VGGDAGGARYMRAKREEVRGGRRGRLRWQGGVERRRAARFDLSGGELDRRGQLSGGVEDPIDGTHM